MDNIKLSKAKKEDFDSYKKLEMEFYSYHKKYKTLLQDLNPIKRNLEKEFLELIEEKNTFFRFIKYNDEIAGYICGLIKKIDENEKNLKKTGSFNTIIISKKFRNKGLAKFMTDEFFKWLKSKKINFVESSTNVKNIESKNFHKKLGFKEQFIKYGKFI